MNKRYWFVVIDYNSETLKGKSNLGFISDDENPFSTTAIKKSIIDSNETIDLDSNKIVIINFFEFKNEKDFNNFFNKN